MALRMFEGKRGVNDEVLRLSHPSGQVTMTSSKANLAPEAVVTDTEVFWWLFCFDAIAMTFVLSWRSTQDNAALAILPSTSL